MRFMSLFVAAVIPALFGSCHDFATQPIGPYDNMFLERIGAMDLGFNVSPTPSVDTLHVEVTHREFHDTTIHMVLVRSDTNTKTFDALTSALNGQAQIFGDFRQSSLPTGTWVRVFMIKGTRRDEVTDVDVRNRLLQFEQMVRSSLASPYPLAP